MNYFQDGYGMPSETKDFDELAILCRGKEELIQQLLLQIHDGDGFEQWKQKAIEYLHNRNTTPNNWDWILGGDEDMIRDGYREGLEPSEYVEGQIEDANR